MTHKQGQYVGKCFWDFKKKTFKEFLIKIGLHVSFVFGVFTIFCLLHNLLRLQSEINIDRVIKIFDVKLQ
jgi:hypothetical protein